MWSALTHQSSAMMLPSCYLMAKKLIVMQFNIESYLSTYYI